MYHVNIAIRVKVCLIMQAPLKKNQKYRPEDVHQLLKLNSCYFCFVLVRKTADDVALEIIKDNVCTARLKNLKNIHSTIEKFFILFCDNKYTGYNGGSYKGIVTACSCICSCI